MEKTKQDEKPDQTAESPRHLPVPSGGPPSRHRNADAFFVLHHAVLDDLMKKSGHRTVSLAWKRLAAGAVSARLIQAILTTLAKVKVRHGERLVVRYDVNQPHEQQPLPLGLRESLPARYVFSREDFDAVDPAERAIERRLINFSDANQANDHQEVRDLVATVDQLESSIQDADEMLTDFAAGVRQSTDSFALQCHSALSDIRGLLKDIRTSGGAHDGGP
jgi:hypothetical protein